MNKESVAKNDYLSNVRAPVQLLGLSSLLCPFVDKVSAQRGMMWASHMNQAQIIDGCEMPRIFTGYESIFGEYEYNSTARDQDIQILAVIPKFNTNVDRYPLAYNPGYTIVYQGFTDNKVGYFQIDRFTMRSAGYGYMNRWMNVPQLNKGNFIPKDMPLCTSPAHDGDSYMLGTNLKVAFMSLPQVTEDAFVISESAAKKLASDGFDKISFKILPTHMPLDLYGNDEEYRFFPDIGEFVREDGIVCALRTPTPETFISDMNKASLTRVNMHDTVFYIPAGSQIMDVDIVVNRKCKVKTPKDIFNQVEKYRHRYNDYCLNIWLCYQEICEQGKECTPEFNALVTRCIGSLLADNIRIPGYQRRADITLIKKKEPIEFIYITLTYKYKNKVSLGYKLSDRYGNSMSFGIMLLHTVMYVE